MSMTPKIPNLYDFNFKYVRSFVPYYSVVFYAIGKRFSTVTICYKYFVAAVSTCSTGCVQKCFQAQNRLRVNSIQDKLNKRRMNSRVTFVPTFSPPRIQVGLENIWKQKYFKRFKKYLKAFCNNPPCLSSSNIQHYHTTAIISCHY